MGSGITETAAGAVSGSSGVTCNGHYCTVITNTLTTAASSTASYTINNVVVSSSSIVECELEAYSGALFTNGQPRVMCNPGAGTITVTVINSDATNALNGTLTLGVLVRP